MEVVAETDVPYAFRKSEPDVVIQIGGGDWLQQVLEDARQRLSDSEPVTKNRIIRHWSKKRVINK